MSTKERIQIIHRQITQGLSASSGLLVAGSVSAFILVVLSITVLLQPDPLEPIPDFTVYEAGEERKQAFFDYFLPLIEERNRELLDARQELQTLYDNRDGLSRRQRQRALAIADEYGLEEFDPLAEDDWNILLRRVDAVPPSLALAQAANESGWGTSRFAREAHNYFGHWCFVEGCGLIPSSRPQGASHEVAAFNSPQHSVERYMHNINNHEAYTDLRRLRSVLRNNGEMLDGNRLVEGLGRYSERGQDYVDEIRSMIRIDDLTQFDVAMLGESEESG